MRGGRASALIGLLIMAAISGCIGEDSPQDNGCENEAHGHHDDGDMAAADANATANADDANATNETGNETETPLRLQANETGAAAGNETMDDGNMTMDHGDEEHEAHAHDDNCAPVDSVVDDDPTDATGNATENATAERAVVLDANSMSAEAPATMTFTGYVEAYVKDGDDSYPVETGAFTWTFSAGDESEALSGDETARTEDGTLSFEHAFEAAGEYTATFTVTFEDAEALSDEVVLTITEAKPEPAQTYFEFGPGLGCAGDAGPEGCLSYHVGDSGPFVDAVWIPLDESYVGWSFTSTVGNARTDSDGWLMDADHAIITDVNGGATQAIGTIPEGAAWLFIFSYAEPHTGITVTFERPA